jgi:hypothetical protein
MMNTFDDADDDSSEADSDVDGLVWAATDRGYRFICDASEYSYDVIAWKQYDFEHFVCSKTFLINYLH